MESSGSFPLAYLTSSNDWAINQEHSLGGPGAWGGGPKISPILAGKWRETKAQHWVNEETAGAVLPIPSLP
eukprot:1137170-Pelagomonas_calceolata.AAC.10